MKNLAAEYWDEIKAKYPQAFAHFSKWIDEYKKEIGWNILFGNLYRPSFEKEIKFHDIPIDMQNGIMARWAFEFYGWDKNYQEYACNFPFELKKHFELAEIKLNGSANNKTQTN